MGERPMKDTKRSPMLNALYPERTDSALEWIAGILGEKDSEIFQTIQNYFQNHLAFANGEFAFIETYYAKSIELIDCLKHHPEKVSLLNQVFDEDMLEIADLVKNKEHQAVKTRIFQMFSDLQENIQVKSVS